MAVNDAVKLIIEKVNKLHVEVCMMQSSFVEQFSSKGYL